MRISDEDHVSGHNLLKVRIREHRNRALAHIVCGHAAITNSNYIARPAMLPKTTGMRVLKRLWTPNIYQNISQEYQENQGRIY